MAIDIFFFELLRTPESIARFWARCSHSRMSPPFRASIEQAIYEREYTKAILNTVVDPVVVLDAKLQVQTANRAFYNIFGVSRDETQGISIRKLGNNEWETSECGNP